MTWDMTRWSADQVADHLRRDPLKWVIWNTQKETCQEQEKFRRTAKIEKVSFSWTFSAKYFFRNIYGTSFSQLAVKNMKLTFLELLVNRNKLECKVPPVCYMSRKTAWSDLSSFCFLSTLSAWFTPAHTNSFDSQWGLQGRVGPGLQMRKTRINVSFSFQEWVAQSLANWGCSIIFKLIWAGTNLPK